MKLPPQIMPVFEGILPCTIITGSADGIPNIANLSRVWMLDSEHVAIANQMLNKTASNLQGNALAMLKLADPSDLQHWELTVRYVRSEVDGLLYDSVSRDLRAISWMAGAESPVPLRSVMIFEVVSVRKCEEESYHLLPAPELYGDLLQVLSEALQWDRSSYWIPNVGYPSLKVIASRGVPGVGTDPFVFEPMDRLASLVASERDVVRLRHIRSQVKYVRTIRAETDKMLRGQSDQAGDLANRALPVSFLGLPVFDFDELIGVICCEAEGHDADVFDRFDDRYVLLLSRKLGKALATIAEAPASERIPRFRQVLERTSMEWDKATEPFHTALSARERQVSVHAAKGLTNTEIAKALFISPRTVTTHLERIYEKLQVSSRAALARYVVERGLLMDENGESSR